MSQKHINQFKDSFKHLKTAANEVKNIGQQVNGVLNKILPSRILSKANIFNMSIEVAEDLSTMVMMHVEDSLVESNINLSQKETSVRGLATLSGHDAIRPISSDGIVNLSINTNLRLVTPSILFSNTTFRSEENNLVYQLLSDVQSIPSSTSSIDLKIVEGSWVENRFIANGDKMETLRLDDNLAIENYHIKVRVNGELWNVADALYDMKSTDKSYLLKNGIGNQVDIIFGDDVHGRRLKEGDVILINHLVTSGEEGNVSNLSKFKIISGVYDSEGRAIDINDYTNIVASSGFMLGSNGEDIDMTRAIAGFNSRALTFTRPENLKAYLSRLSVLSYIDVWTNQDSNIFNILILPNISRVIHSYRDYLQTDISKFTLNQLQKSSIVEYINTSGAQTTSTELLLVDPVFDKYAIFVYINATILDKNILKNQIEETISKVFLDSTFLNADMSTQGVISQTAILESIWSINNIHQANIDIVSEKNELARINGFYYTDEVKNVGSAKQIVSVRKTVSAEENPNLGFDELGTIVAESDRKIIPILRSGFLKYNPEGENVLLEKPIYIFYKTVNGFEEL